MSSSSSKLRLQQLENLAKDVDKVIEMCFQFNDKVIAIYGHKSCGKTTLVQNYLLSGQLKPIEEKTMQSLLLENHRLKQRNQILQQQINALKNFEKSREKGSEKCIQEISSNRKISSDVKQQQQLWLAHCKDAMEKFYEKKLSKGIQYLIDCGLLKDNPKDIAYFLFTLPPSPTISKEVGVYLGIC